jgi:hypothetical protein
MGDGRVATALDREIIRDADALLAMIEDSVSDPNEYIPSRIRRAAYDLRRLVDARKQLADG